MQEVYQCGSVSCGVISLARCYQSNKGEERCQCVCGDRQEIVSAWNSNANIRFVGVHILTEMKRIVSFSRVFIQFLYTEKLIR
jgi:hypothetical protein